VRIRYLLLYFLSFSVLQAQDLQYIKKEMVSYYYLESDPLFVGRDKSFKDIHQDLVKEEKRYPD
jgi:hypothetical protein